MDTMDELENHYDITEYKINDYVEEFLVDGQIVGKANASLEPARYWVA